MSKVSSWPVDADGNPMALVSWSLGETINLGDYSNIKIGPGEVTRFVKDTEEDRDAGLRKCMQEVETALAEERHKVIDFRDNRPES